MGMSTGVFLDVRCEIERATAKNIVMIDLLRCVHQDTGQIEILL